MRLATNEDIKQFETTRKKTVHAWVVDHNGPQAIFGYFIENGKAIIFSDEKENARKIVPWVNGVIYKAAILATREAAKTGLPVYAQPDNSRGDAEKLLERIGFRSKAWVN